jgi:transposase-like protein
VAHRTARLNPFGRRLLIDRVLGAGWTVATAAEAQGISRATGHKWVRRYRLEGPAGLGRPELQTPSLAERHIGPGGPTDRRGAAGLALGARSAGAVARLAALDRRRRPAPQRAAAPGGH